MPDEALGKEDRLFLTRPGMRRVQKALLNDTWGPVDVDGQKCLTE